MNWNLLSLEDPFMGDFGCDEQAAYAVLQIAQRHCGCAWRVMHYQLVRLGLLTVIAPTPIQHTTGTIAAILNITSSGLMIRQLIGVMRRSGHYHRPLRMMARARPQVQMADKVPRS